MSLNFRSILMVTGMITILGVPASPTALASPPICQVWVTSLGNSHVTLIDGATSAVSSLDISDTSWNVVVTPDGSKAYFATNSSGIKVIDIDGGYATSTISEPSFILATSPDGDELYSTDWSPGNVKEFSTATDTATGRSDVTGINPIAMAVSPDGAAIYVANYNSSPATITKIVTSTFTATDYQVDPGGALPAGVAVSPDGTKLYSVLYFGGAVQEIQTSDMTVLRTVSVPTNSRDVVTNSTGSKIYVTSSNTDEVKQIDTLTFTVTDTIAVGVQPEKLAISPDDRFLFVTNEADDSVSKIDLSTNSVVDTIAVTDQPYGIAIGPSSCTTVAPAPVVTPAAVVPETSVETTTTTSSTTSVVPTTVVSSLPTELPETGVEITPWILIATISLTTGMVMASRRRQQT